MQITYITKKAPIKLVLFHGFLDLLIYAGFSTLSALSAVYAGQVVRWQEETTAAVMINAIAKMICRVFIVSMFSIKLTFKIFLC